MSSPSSRFYYSNTETKLQNGTRTVRKVYIKNGNGYKSVTRYNKGKKVSSVKKPIHLQHVDSIQMGVFIPRFFADCDGPYCLNSKTRKVKYERK